MSNSNIGATATPQYTIDDLYDAVKDDSPESVQKVQQILSQPYIDPNALSRRAYRPPIDVLAGDYRSRPDAKEVQKQKMKLFLAHPNIDPAPDGATAGSVVGEAAKEPNPDLLKLILESPKININISLYRPSLLNPGSVEENRHALDEAIRVYKKLQEQGYTARGMKYGYPNNSDELILQNIDMIINHPNIEIDVLKKYVDNPVIGDRIRKRLDTMIPRGLAELSHKEQLPPEVTAKIFGQITGKEPTMDDYLDRQFDFKQRLEREAREKQKKSLKNIGKSNKGGRKTRRKPTSVRYLRSAKTRSSKKVQ
jgi:hypothetical protein